MTEQDKARAPDRPWSFPVRLDEVPETGLQVALSADAATRAALARLAGVRAVPRLDAKFDVVPIGKDGLHVTGEVRALVEQTCVVTLEPMQNEVIEPVDLAFTPQGALPSGTPPAHGRDTGEEPPDRLIGGGADLGSVATEFLLLGIDPYPRKPGAVFEPPPIPAAGAGPFAALSGLQKKRSRDDQAR